MIKNKLIAIPIAILMFSIIGIASFADISVQASVLFQDGFESRDYSNWIGKFNFNPIGSTGIIQSAVKYSGSYALKLTPVDVVGAYSVLGGELGSPYSTLYYRAYVNFDALPDTNGDILLVTSFIDSTWSVDTASATVVFDKGALKWGVQYSTNTVANNYVNSSAKIVNINTWYCVEFEVVNGAGTGSVHLWIDGVEVVTVTGITNNSYRSQYPYACAEFKGGSFPVNVYIDDISIASESNPTLTPTPSPTSSPSPTPSSTPAPTAKPTPTPSPTPTSSPTPSPTPTPTITPTPTPIPSQLKTALKVDANVTVTGADLRKSSNTAYNFYFTIVKSGTNHITAEIAKTALPQISYLRVYINNTNKPFTYVDQGDKWVIDVVTT